MTTEVGPVVAILVLNDLSCFVQLEKMLNVPALEFHAFQLGHFPFTQLAPLA